MESVLVSTTSQAQGLSLAHLSEHTARYVEAGLQGAPNTAKAYAGDLKRFGAWCSDHGLEPLPASVDTLAGFVTHLTETGKKVAAIQQYCAAVFKAHVMRCIDFTVKRQEVKGAYRKYCPA